MQIPRSAQALQRSSRCSFFLLLPDQRVLGHKCCIVVLHKAQFASSILSHHHVTITDSSEIRLAGKLFHFSLLRVQTVLPGCSTQQCMLVCCPDENVTGVMLQVLEEVLSDEHAACLPLCSVRSQQTFPKPSTQLSQPLLKLLTGSALHAQRI